MTEPFFTPTPSSRRSKSSEEEEEEEEVPDASYPSHPTSPTDPSYHDDSHSTSSFPREGSEKESVVPPVGPTKQVVRYMNEETLRRLAHLPFGADTSRVRSLDGRLSAAEKFKVREKRRKKSNLQTTFITRNGCV
jgi:hypothetical protein